MAAAIPITIRKMHAIANAIAAITIRGTPAGAGLLWITAAPQFGQKRTPASTALPHDEQNMSSADARHAHDGVRGRGADVAHEHP